MPIGSLSLQSFEEAFPDGRLAVRMLGSNLQ
jgi:hypothetical protein